MSQKAQTIFYKLVFKLSNFNDQKQSYDQLKNAGLIAKYTLNLKRDNSNDTGLCYYYYYNTTIVE